MLNVGVILAAKPIVEGIGWMILACMGVFLAAEVRDYLRMEPLLSLDLGPRKLTGEPADQAARTALQPESLAA